MKVTIDQLFDKLDDVFNAIARNKDQIEIPPLLEIEGAMKQRIHTDGIASDGTQIGDKYSRGYERFKGRKVGQGDLYPINLQLEGDLIKGYTTGNKGGENVLMFQDTFSRDKAGWNEENYNKPIFKPAPQEIEDGGEIFQSQVRDVLISLFR